MIKSFRHKGLELFASEGSPRKLGVQNHDRVSRILGLLDAAKKAEDLNLPGLHFHALKGDQEGRFSVRVTGNWRITYGFVGTDAVDVDLEDYH